MIFKKLITTALLMTSFSSIALSDTINERPVLIIVNQASDGQSSYQFPMKLDKNKFPHLGHVAIYQANDRINPDTGLRMSRKEMLTQSYGLLSDTYTLAKWNKKYTFLPLMDAGVELVPEIVKKGEVNLFICQVKFDENVENSLVLGLCEDIEDYGRFYFGNVSLRYKDYNKALSMKNYILSGRVKHIFLPNEKMNQNTFVKDIFTIYPTYRQAWTSSINIELQNTDAIFLTSK